MQKLGKKTGSITGYTLEDEIYPTLDLSMDALKEQEELDVDNVVVLHFKAIVTRVIKDGYNNMVSYSLTHGELEPKTYEQKSKAGVIKLRGGIRKTRITMPGGA